MGNFIPERESERVPDKLRRESSRNVRILIHSESTENICSFAIFDFVTERKNFFEFKCSLD